MSENPSAPPIGEKQPKPLWPTAAGLALLFAVLLAMVRLTEWSMFVATTALLSILVSLGGVLAHAFSGVGRALRRRGALARDSFARAGLYLLFGIVSLVAARIQGGAVDDFRRGLQPGMRVDEALTRFDALYLEHPRRWRYISVWGTPEELALSDYRKIGEEREGVVTFTWRAEPARTSEELAREASVLSKCRQVWFTLRTDVGFVHFFVNLDANGRIQSVSETTGHQA